MAKWWDNIKERLGIGKSEQDRELEKQAKEQEDRNLKEQEREAKNVFFRGLRSDEKTEQRAAQRNELSELRKGFAENEQKVADDRRNKAVNDPAFKDFPDEPKVPAMNNALRQRPEIPAGKPSKASKPLPQVPGEFVDTMSSNEKLPMEPRQPLVPKRAPPEPPMSKPKVQTLEEFNRDMDKAVEAALSEDRAKTAAKAAGPVYGAMPDDPKTFTDKNSVKQEERTVEGIKRGRAATQYEGMPTKDTQYVELDKIPKPVDKAYGVMPSQDSKGQYGGMTTKGYETLPEVREAVDGKPRPQEAARPRAQTAAEKYPSAEREQTPVFKAVEEVRGRDDARRLTRQMDAIKFDSVNKGMEQYPAAAEATKGALKEGKELDAALKVGGKVVESEVRSNVERTATSMEAPDLVARQAAKNAVRDQYSGMGKAIEQAEIQRAAKQYGATEEISKQTKRLTVANPSKDSPYGEMPSMAAAVKDFPPKDVAALMGAAGKAAGQRSNDSLSSVDPKASSRAPDAAANAKAGGSKGIEH